MDQSEEAFLKRVVIDLTKLNTLGTEPWQREKSIHKGLDRPDEVRVAEELLPMWRASQAALDLFASDIGVGQDANAAPLMRPACSHQSQLGSQQGGLSAAWCGLKVSTGGVEQRFGLLVPIKLEPREEGWQMREIVLLELE
jgi:hypothetical protein